MWWYDCCWCCYPSLLLSVRWGQLRAAKSKGDSFTEISESKHDTCSFSTVEQKLNDFWRSHVGCANKNNPLGRIQLIHYLHDCSRFFYEICRFYRGGFPLYVQQISLQYLFLIKNYIYSYIYTVSQKNDTDVAHNNFTAHQPIFVIFGRDIAEWVCYWMIFVFPPLLTNVSAIPWETWTPELGLFSHVQKRHWFTCYIFDTHQPILIIFCRE